MEDQFKILPIEEQNKIIKNIKESNPFLASNESIIFSMAAQEYNNYLQKNIGSNIQNN